MRSFYSNNIKKFLEQNTQEIFGTIAQNNTFDLNDLQRNTWLMEIKIFKNILKDFESNGRIIFEYTIPRIGKRIDNVLIIDNIIFCLNLKLVKEIIMLMR